MLGFGLLNVYCRFLWFKPRFGEKCLRWIQANEVWAMRIKRSLQRGPKDPRKGKTRGPRRNTERPKRGAQGKTTGQPPQWPPRPVVAATVRPWWLVFSPVVGFSFACLFDFRRFLLCFAFKCWCIWTFQRTGIHSIALSFHSPLDF